MLTRPDPTPIGLRPLDDLLPKAAPQATGPLPPSPTQGGWTAASGYVAPANWPPPLVPNIAIPTEEEN
jgi:hypothetical protein